MQQVLPRALSSADEPKNMRAEGPGLSEKMGFTTSLSCAANVEATGNSQVSRQKRSFNISCYGGTIVAIAVRMLKCNSCEGFVPAANKACPHCGARIARGARADRVLRAAKTGLIAAGASMTLMACYGGPVSDYDDDYGVGGTSAGGTFSVGGSGTGASTSGGNGSGGAGTGGVAAGGSAGGNLLGGYAGDLGGQGGDLGGFGGDSESE